MWPHAEGETRRVLLNGELHACELWSDWIELEGAEAVGVFDDGWLSGRPAVTRNGTAWYVGTQLDPRGLDALVGRLVAECGLAAPLDVPSGVEAVRREGGGRSFLFLLNHRGGEASVDLDGEYRDAITGEAQADALTLEPFGVAVLETRPAP
jgi:beta-galactosidase